MRFVKGGFAARAYDAPGPWNPGEWGLALSSHHLGVLDEA
jgi:hypothetical protein